MRCPSSNSSSSKHSTRGKPSTETLTAQWKRAVLRSQSRLPHPSFLIASDTLDAGSSGKPSPRKSSSGRSTAFDRMDRQDGPDSDVDVDYDLQSSDSSHHDPEPSLESVARPPYSEEASDVEVQRSLYLSPTSSDLVAPSGSSSPIDVEDAPLQDKSPEGSLRSSYSLTRASSMSTDMHEDDGASALALPSEVVIKLEEDEDDRMPTPSQVDVKRSLEPSSIPWQDEWWKPAITFPDNAMDEEKMNTINNYMSRPDLQGHEDDVSDASAVAHALGGVTKVSLSFDCPGWQGEDDDEHRERRRDAVTTAVRQLSAVLGDSLRGLKVTAPWPELSFPCVPDILEVILDSFPALRGLRFEDSQCGCLDCESVYTDSARFKRLQIAALKNQLPGPLQATTLRTIEIERKSMYSLDKDFMNYTGDAAHLAGEVLVGFFTVAPGKDCRARLTARAQEEAQFFIKLLKRDLPSASHFLVGAPELRFAYVASSPPSMSPGPETERGSPVRAFSRSWTPAPVRVCREGSVVSSCTFSTSGCTRSPDARGTTPVVDLSADLSGDICPQDDVSNEVAVAAQDVDHALRCPQSNGVDVGYESLALDAADFALVDGVDGFSLPIDSDWYRVLAKPMRGGGSDGPGGEDMRAQPFVSFPTWSYGPVWMESSFGDDSGEAYTEPSSSLVHDPAPYWMGDVAGDQPHVPPESTTDTGLPHGWFGYEDAAVVVSEEIDLDTARGWMQWIRLGPGGVGAAAASTSYSDSMLANDAGLGLSVPAEHALALEYPQASSYSGLDHDYEIY